MDEVDHQVDRDLAWDEARVRAIQARAAKIPVGEPGDCDKCGEYFGRLVDGICARCRDRHRLP
jgi:hypothetical protein